MWPPGPELLCGWEQGCPASLSAEQSVLGNVSPGLGLPICHRGSHTWKLPRRRATKRAVGKRGQWGAPRNTPCYLTDAQPSALSPGLWLQAQWGLSGERPKLGGTGGSWEKSKGSPWPSWSLGGELRPEVQGRRLHSAPGTSCCHVRGGPPRSSRQDWDTLQPRAPPQLRVWAGHRPLSSGGAAPPSRD